MTENGIGTLVLETAIAIHRELGPGLLETVYERSSLPVNWANGGWRLIGKCPCRSRTAERSETAPRRRE